MNPSLPLVTIGIPTYNRARTLKRAIESALQQDYSNLEVTILDNCSTDDTKSLCSQFCLLDPRIQYHRQPATVPRDTNFRDVLALSRGTFFMWLADDDWIEPAYISQCVQELESHADYVVVRGTDKFYDKDGLCLFTGEPTNLLANSGGERLVAYYSLVSLNGSIYGLIRRDTLSKISLLDTIASDWFLVGTLAYLGKIRTLETVSIKRSLGGVSSTVRGLAREYNLSEFQTRHLYLTIAGILFWDIVSHPKIYEGLTITRRFLVGAQAALIIVTRFYSPSTRQYANSVTRGIAEWLNRYVFWRLRRELSPK